MLDSKKALSCAVNLCLRCQRNPARVILSLTVTTEKETRVSAVQNIELLLIRTILKASERKRITATQYYHRTNRLTANNSQYKRRENMTKVGIFVLADTNTHADMGRVANVLETAKV